MNLLKDIVISKRIEIERARRQTTLSTTSRAGHKPKRDLRRALLNQGIAVIAEVKSRSPSTGVLKNEFDPAGLARAYERSGAAAISVLTDKKYFGGAGEHIEIVKDSVSLPVLRKDFIIDPFQIHESDRLGADAVLLIMRLLEPETAREFMKIIEKTGMACLVETHTREEIDRALEIGASIIGVNNRDLDTLKIDLDRSLQLRKYIPRGVVAISQSGINDRSDIELMINAGFDAVLVGTVLMRAPSVAEKLLELTGRRSE